MARKIVITSGKGGVGKTTICVGLGIGLARQGLKVLLVDGDIGLNNLDILAGVDSMIYYDVLDVLKNKCRPQQAIVTHKKYINLSILASVKSIFSEQIDKHLFKKVINSFDETFDYILIDCPAGIENGFERAVFCADEAILITTPHIPAILNGNKVISLLNSKYNNKIGLIINKSKQNLVAKKFMIGAEQIVSMLGVPLIEIIDYIEELSIMASINGALELSKRTEEIFDGLAQNLHNAKNRVLNYNKNSNFFVKFNTNRF